MQDIGPPWRGLARAVALLLIAASLGSLVGCGDGAGRGDRAMIDPTKADGERKSAEDALRKSYTPDKMKPKGVRR